jgi:hypothetical protein
MAPAPHVSSEPALPPARGGTLRGKPHHTCKDTRVAVRFPTGRPPFSAPAGRSLSQAQPRGRRAEESVSRLHHYQHVNNVWSRCMGLYGAPRSPQTETHLPTSAKHQPRCRIAQYPLSATRGRIRRCNTKGAAPENAGIAISWSESPGFPSTRTFKAPLAGSHEEHMCVSRIIPSRPPCRRRASGRPPNL